MQVLPSEILRPYIRHYLFFTIPKEIAQEYVLRFFPDGCHSMVFTFGSALQVQDTHSTSKMPGSFLYGSWTSYKDVIASRPMQVAVVVFQPFGVYRLFGIPGATITNAIIPLDNAIGNITSELYAQLEQSEEAQLAAIFNHFFTRFLQQAVSADTIIDAALHHIHKKAGVVSSAELTRMGCSERQMERKFLHEIGITPSAYAGIVRMHSFLNNLIHLYPQESLTQLAYDAQYTDQSHLIKSFKKITGITPTKYVHTKNKFARNFIGMDAAAR